MGLDQYLSARRYIGAWKHQKNDSERAMHDAVARAVGMDGWRCEHSPHIYVEMSAAYWRKANQVHAWFVDNVQEGKDDCGKYYVSREQLEELRDTCKAVLASTKLIEGKVTNGMSSSGGGPFIPNIEDGKVLEDSTTAEKLLPPTSGCFFGNTEFNQWYWEDLEQTVAQIDKTLGTFGEGWGFEYHSSW